MRKKVIFNLALATYCSVSMLSSSGVATARPTATQVEGWLKAGAAAVGITGTIYGGYNTYIKNGEVQRNLTDKNGRTLFTFTANCRDRGNISRFWQHPDNGTAAQIISGAFPNDTRRQARAVRYFINMACGSF